MDDLAGACRWARFAFAALEEGLVSEWRSEGATDKTVHDNDDSNSNDVRIERDRTSG